MSKYIPKKFQQKAIDELIGTFKKLWHNPDDRLEIVFKSPTGSGKTFMVCNFVNNLNYQPDFEEDIAFVWITFSDDLAMQSRDKFYDYYFPNFSNQLLTVQDFSQGVLKKNDIMFLNWQKLVSKKASDRVLRRPDNPDEQKEQGFYFEDIAEQTHCENRKIVMIIDESHKNVTSNALRDVINPLNPKIILKVSATPDDIPDGSQLYNNRAGFVEVNRQDVVNEGLIKEEIISQTEDELNVLTPQDHDTLLLDLAIEKRESIKRQWQRINQNVNPLVLIQLPNDEKKIKDTDVKSKEEIVTQYLTTVKGIEKNKIAYWFDARKENMERIDDNDNPVEYMLFKQAAGTGWDCPRAHILVMYRDIKSCTFRTQTLGRILRMPVMDVDLSEYPDLRTGFLYTNYQRYEVQNPDEKKFDTKPKTVVAKIDPQQKINFAVSTFTTEVANTLKDTVINKGIAKETATKIIQNAVAQTQIDFKEKAQQISVTAQSNNAHPMDVTQIHNEAKSVITQNVKEQFKTENQSFSKEEEDELDLEIAEIISGLLDTVADKQESEFTLDESLISDYISRTDYGDIGKVSTFQEHFMNFMCGHFRVNEMQDEDDKRRNLLNSGLKLDTILEQDVMVNARFRSEIDDSKNELGKNIKFEMSDNDVEKEFTWRCYETIENLSPEYRIGNIARSWGPFKEALCQWFRVAMDFYPDMVVRYRVFLNDIHKGDNSIFKDAINKCFAAYRPLLEKHLKEKREKEALKNQPFKIKTTYLYPDDYKDYPVNCSVVKPFRLPEKYSGRDNETAFIKYIEGKYDKIEWWLKNGTGKDSLAFKYVSSQDNKERLFYPDWIIKFKDKRIGIFDTKGGITAKSIETKDKAEELQRRIKTLNATSRRFKYVGGIVEKREMKWVFNDAEEYVYERDEDWKEMEVVF